MRLTASFTIFWILFWTANSYAVASPTLDENHDPPLTPITMQLRWKHQFQFAGYYAAREKGFYQRAGLDVTLVEGAPGREPITEVLEGRAHYGEANSELIYSRMQGAPLIALAAIFQHSPSILLARRDSGIRSPQDFVGKRVMLVGGAHDYGLLAMLTYEGITTDQVEIIPSSYEIQDLIDGNTDLFNAYLTNEPFYMQQQGIAIQEIHPINYGIDLYSDILFTSEEELENHPQRVKAFRKATLHGWQYAMEHPAEIIDLILSEYSDRKSRAHLEFEAEAMKDLIMPTLVDMGHINPGRINRMALLFIEMGLLKNGDSLEGFIYNPDAGPDLEWVWPLVGGILLALLLIIGITTYLWRLNKRLAEEVEHRSLVEKKLRYTEQHARRIINELQDIYYRTNNDGIIREISPSLTNILGYKVEEVLGTSIENLYLPNFSRSDFLRQLDEKGGAIHDYELQMRAKNGDAVWVSASSHLLEDDNGATIGVEGVIHDITKNKLYQEYFEQLALMDPLTRLPNRRHLLRILRKSISTSKRHNQRGAILFLDLDRFKPVNDQYGHSVGDKLLQAVATRFSQFLRAEDTAARLGGDEFIILLSQLNSDESLALEEAKSVAEKSIAYLEQPFDVDELIIEISASVGITLFPSDDLDGDQLLQQADIAMYAAKEQGRGGAVSYQELPPGQQRCDR